MLPLIGIDVDGTLVGSSGEPTDAVWASATAAVERGQHLALCTARLAKGKTWDWACRLDPDGWHVFHAGAAVLHSGTGAVEQFELSADQVGECEEIADRRGWVLEHYTARDYAVDSDHPLAVGHAGLMGLPFERRSPSVLADQIVRVQFVVPIDEASDVLAHHVSGTSGTGATSPAQPDAAFISFVNQDASKGRALGFVADHLGTDLGSTMMVGDGHNDLDAVIAVGHGVAMGNADPVLSNAANHHVAHVDNDGLVEALELSARLST